MNDGPCLTDRLYTFGLRLTGGDLFKKLPSWLLIEFVGVITRDRLMLIAQRASCNPLCRSYDSLVWSLLDRDPDFCNIVD